MNRIFRAAPRSLALLAFTALVAACVTVNIYFPAAQVEQAADRIVDDVYGTQPAPEKEQKPTSALASGLLAVLDALGPAAAHAQDATSVSNAAIRGHKQRIAENHQQLAPFYASGNVGIGNDGDLVVRTTDGLALPQVAGLKRLVAADNAERAALYEQVAAALNLDPGQVGRVRGIFAAKWRDKAEPGWWVQADDGSWNRK